MLLLLFKIYVRLWSLMIYQKSVLQMKAEVGCRSLPENVQELNTVGHDNVNHFCINSGTKQ